MSQISLNCLPKDYVILIAYQAEGESILKMVQVCKSWRLALTSAPAATLWKFLLEKEFAVFTTQKTDYRQIYKERLFTLNYWRASETARYAFSLWGHPLKNINFSRNPILYQPQKAILKKFELRGDTLSLAPYDKRMKRQVESSLITLQLYKGFTSGDSRAPSTVTENYWVQAPVPVKLYPRFCHITQYSGKLIVYTNLKEIDNLWLKFKAAYSEGKLGYALRASTDKPNAHNNESQRIITIHLENCFDLEEVGRIAWEVNQILGKWKGVLQCIPDLISYFHSTHTHIPLKKNTLFTISSFVFKKHGKTKPQALFISLFMAHNISYAKEVFQKFSLAPLLR